MADKICRDTSYTNSLIKAKIGNSKVVRVSNNASFTVPISDLGVWLLYRSYQPNLVLIKQDGTSEVGFGSLSNVTISISSGVLTVTNKIGWSMLFVVFAE